MVELVAAFTQLSPVESQAFPASANDAFGDPWKATPSSTGTTKCAPSFLETRLPHPTVIIGAARLKVILPVPVIGLEGSLEYETPPRLKGWPEGTVAVAVIGSAAYTSTPGLMWKLFAHGKMS